MHVVQGLGVSSGLTTELAVVLPINPEYSFKYDGSYSISYRPQVSAFFVVVLNRLDLYLL